MNIVTYILKKTIIYIGWVMGLMIIYGVLTAGAGLDFGLNGGNISMAVILFAYPFYCVMKSTVHLALLYFDESVEANRAQAFAGLFQVLVPDAFDGRPNRIFVMNMVSKFLQILLIATLVYSFVTGDAGMLRAISLLLFLVVAGFVVLFARAMIKDYSHRTEQQLRSLESIRESEGGIKIDPERRAEFMKKPLGLMTGNLILAVLGVVILWSTPMVSFMPLYYLLHYTEIIGCISVLFLPFTVSYMIRENHNAQMYTLRMAKGDYGQDKLDFFTYSGKGEDMNDERFIIDRVDQIDPGPRYIRVSQRASVRKVRIPKTMSLADERILLQYLRDMTDEGRPGAIDRKSEEIRRNMDDPI